MGVSSLDSTPPLATDEDVWFLACSRVEQHLIHVSRGQAEPLPAGLAAAASMARTGATHTQGMVGLLRRVLVRLEIGGEARLRCLRALARTGERVDRTLLSRALDLAGRPPRIALATLAELAARGDAAALAQLTAALRGPLRNDAAALLASIASDGSIDALSEHLRTPGLPGILAAEALMSVEDDPFAFEVLCERLCEPADSFLAGRALWNAAPHGVRLTSAAASLARWERRGVKSAAHGCWMARVFLTAGGIAHDLPATLSAVHSSDDEIVLLGAQAAYAVGDAERARGALLGLFRRGPTLASQAFAVLSHWADLGDEGAYSMLRTLLERRPIDLSRTAIFDALASTTRPVLRQVVARGVVSADRVTSLEACRALSKLREPPSLVPPLWL